MGYLSLDRRDILSRVCRRHTQEYNILHGRIFEILGSNCTLTRSWLLMLGVVITV